MGYKESSSSSLMKILAGKPYIDTSLSFESFLPHKLDKNSSLKILAKWREILSKKTYLHDKLEFDVAITCFSFDIKDKVKNIFQKI